MAFGRKACLDLKPSKTYGGLDASVTHHYHLLSSLKRKPNFDLLLRKPEKLEVPQGKVYA